MSGTVNISRGIWDDKAFKPEPLTEREAWVWMVMDASYKARTKEVNGAWVDLERGQLSCSVRFMCKAWKWSKSKVDRFLKRLENRDMIGTDSGTGINVITICKYDEYQSKSKDSGTAKSEKRDSGGTAVGQRRDKPNKDERKVKEGCKTSPNGEDGQAVDFTKEVFDRGVAFLSKYGTSEKQARSLIGKWRKNVGDTETFNALRDASREGVSEPVSWITARLRPKVDNFDEIFAQATGGAR